MNRLQQATPETGSLCGLTAFVTGGAKGIGLAIARRLAADGAAIALIGRDVVALQQAASELDARCAVADVTDHATFSDAIAALGPCDILVNNAGAAISKPFAKHAMSDFQAMLAVNLLSAVSACQAVLPGMRTRGFGRIINIASTAGLKGYAYVTAYVAAKHALVGFTRALALETVKPCWRWPAPWRPLLPPAAVHRKRRAASWHQAILPDGWFNRKTWPRRSRSSANAPPAQ